MSGWSLMAAWSTYGFETAVCYTREFKDPKRDTFKAIFYAGLLCTLVFTLVPMAFTAMWTDLYIQADDGARRAGILPHVTLAAGVLVVYFCHRLLA
ncbi:amino acid permease [Pseudomonas sp. GG8]